MSDDLSNLPGAVVVGPAKKAEEKSDWDAVSFATGVARSIGQGITFGFADEAEAYVRSILGDQTYEEAKKATNAELAKFRGENPFLSFGLEIGAAVMTPGGLLKIASKVPGLAKVAQKGMQTTTPITRGAAGGALYGAGTAETKADIPASMALGAGLGYAGAKYAPAITEGAKELIKRGIPLSVGQRLGGTIGMLEEGLSKLPIGAEMIGPTRLKALQQFATASYNEALSPLGKKVKKGASPRDAAKEAQEIFSDSYKKALQGVEIDAGAGFIDDVQGVIAPYVQALDKQGREKLEQFIIDEIFERAPGDKLTGESIQAIQRRFGELAQTYMKSTDAYQSTLGRAIRAVDAEMMDLVGKYYPAKADLLRKTNEAYSMYYPVRAAATGAGVRENVFTPARLLSAVQREERKAGAAGLNRLERGEGRLQQFAETAAETIGAKVPESAPLRTMMTMGGVGGGAAIDPVMTALALGGGKLAYTRRGQTVIGGGTMPSGVPLMGGRQAGVIPAISAGMRSPATAGLLAAEAAPTVTPMASGLLGIPSAEAGMLPGAGEARIPEPGVRYETITDRLGRPVTYAITDGGATMTRVTP